MSEESKTKKQTNKLKVYSLAILIYLIVNGLVFELFIEFLEDHSRTHLFPMFPYTRVILLIITILIAKSYIDKTSPVKPRKSKPPVRIAKYIFLTVIFLGLTIGAYLSVILYEEPRPPVTIPKFQQPEPYQIER